MISCIVAVSQNNAIGKNNKMLWHIKEELAYFKKVTLNHTIIMGRKTFESLPSVLPNRDHIVITKNKNFYINNDSVTIEHEINKVLNKYKDSSNETFIIGGRSIYEAALPICDKLYLTRVHQNFEADVFFPKVNFSDFTLIEKSATHKDTKSSLTFTFEVYKRN